jgi:hypothetical protein
MVVWRDSFVLDLGLCLLSLVVVFRTLDAASFEGLESFGSYSRIKDLIRPLKAGRKAGPDPCPHGGYTIRAGAGWSNSLMLSYNGPQT